MIVEQETLEDEWWMHPRTVDAVASHYALMGASGHEMLSFFQQPWEHQEAYRDWCHPQE